MRKRMLLIVILIVAMIAIVAFVPMPVTSRFPTPIYVYLKGNQTAIIQPTTFCDEFLVEQVSPSQVNVTCRVWLR